MPGKPTEAIGRPQRTELRTFGTLRWEEIDHIGMWKVKNQPLAGVWVRDRKAFRRRTNPLMGLLMSGKRKTTPDLQFAKRHIAPYEPEQLIDEMSRRANGRVAVASAPPAA